MILFAQKKRNRKWRKTGHVKYSRQKQLYLCPLRIYFSFRRTIFPLKVFQQSILVSVLNRKDEIHRYEWKV